MTTELQYYTAFLIIGISTFFLRAIFLFYSPEIIRKPNIRHGLNSISSSLLVVLVIPFALFEDQKFLPFRIEVISILLAGLITSKTNKPGLSLIIALLIYAIAKLMLGL